MQDPCTRDNLQLLKEEACDIVNNVDQRISSVIEMLAPQAVGAWLQHMQQYAFVPHAEAIKNGMLEAIQSEKEKSAIWDLAMLQKVSDLLRYANGDKHMLSVVFWTQQLLKGTLDTSRDDLTTEVVEDIVKEGGILQNWLVGFDLSKLPDAESKQKLKEQVLDGIQQTLLPALTRKLQEESL